MEPCSRGFYFLADKTGEKSSTCTSGNLFHHLSWLDGLLATVSLHIGTCLAIGSPLATLAGKDRTGVSWRRRPVECLPTLSFSLGPSMDPPCVPCPAPAPARGREWNRKDPIASHTAPLQKESYLRAAHSALSASFSWGSAPGRRGGGGGGVGGEGHMHSSV